MPSDDNAANRGRRGTSLVPDRTTRNGPVPVALGLTGAAMMAIALAALLLAGCAAGPGRPGFMHAAWNSPVGFRVAGPG